MIETQTFTLFALSSLVLLLTPGPAVLYIITRSIHQGRNAGLLSATGLGLGNLIQAAAAAAGLSVLLTTSELIFTAIKGIGAAYLIFIGVRTLVNRTASSASRGFAPMSLPRVFREGLLINIFNPKVTIFFLAFLPQFVSPGTTHTALQVFFLGGSFALLGILTDSLYAVLAGSLGGYLLQNPAFTRIEKTAAGIIYITLGISALLFRTGSPK